MIDFIMRQDGLDKSQAVAWLKEKSGSVFKRKPAPISGPEKPLQPQDAAALLQRVVAFYSKTFRKDRKGQDYLTGRKLSEAALFDVFQVGYSNGTLHKALPKSGEIIQGLKALGVLNARGQEHFRGCITVPIFDDAGVAGIYGRRITDDESKHLYLPGPHRGVWNAVAAKNHQTLFITEAILDGMSLWQAGHRNVIALYGANGWTDDHEQLLKENGATEIYLCLDNDKAGEEATARLEKEILPPLVKQIHVIRWPEGVKDVNDFFLSRSPADFEKQCLAPFQPAPPVAVPQKTEGEQIEMTPDGFVARYGNRRYELRAIERPGPARLKATIKAVSSDPANAGRFHIDTVDFYLSRSRRVFVGEAARLFRETVEVIESDVNRLIGQVEAYAQKQLEESQAASGVGVGSRPGRRLEAGQASRSGGRSVARHGEAGRHRGKCQQADWLPDHDQPEDARPAGVVDPFRQRSGQEPFAGRHSFALSRRGLAQADLIDRPRSILQGRGLAAAQGAGGGGTGRGAGGRLRHPQSHQRQETGH